MNEMIYFDNAATTYPKPEQVYQVMDDVNRHMAVNAGRGSYALAQSASALIEETRKSILEIVKAEDAAEVVLTASATLACNQILGGISWENVNVVYVSPYEHNAMMRALYHQKEVYGFRIEELAMDIKNLTLDISRIKYQFSTCPPDVVIMTHVSNVTGYILPVQEVLEAAEKYQPITIIDASQAFCLVPIELRSMPVDFYVFAGHKTPYGPFGIGGFVNNHARRLNTYLAGGTGSDSLNLKMPESGSSRYEPGSPNIVAIAGLKAALETLGEEALESGLLDMSGQGAVPEMSGESEEEKYKSCPVDRNERIREILQREQHMTEYLTEQLSKISGVRLYLPNESREHVGIVAFNVAGLQAEDVAMILDEDYHIAVRAGYHCAPLIHKYIPNVDSAGVVRASLGRFTTIDEIDSLVRAVEEIAEG